MLHKIRGVDKSICTCEQKVAYNFCQAYSHYSLDRILEFIDINEGIKKYDVPVIKKIVADNFDKYLNTKYHILGSYEEIGKMFEVTV